MTLAILSNDELDKVTGGWGGFNVTFNPQTNVQGAQIALFGDNAALQNNSSGTTKYGSNSGISTGNIRL